MTKLATKHQPVKVVYDSPLELVPAHRLIVLVPSLEVDLTSVTQRVWELASAIGAHIKFISLCHDVTNESSLRRKLITMSAIVNYDNVYAETEVIVGRDWVEAVKIRQQPGDMIVCFEEQRTGLMQKPLSQILRSDLDVPIYILSGLYPQNNSSPNWQARAGVWLGSILIVLGFLMLQVRIYHFATNWTILVTLLSTAVEFWLIWIWNNLFA